jgi:hypothetical protein
MPVLLAADNENQGNVNLHLFSLASEMQGEMFRFFRLATIFSKGLVKSLFISCILSSYKSVI